ncbi:putative virion structural protein [Salmonella phage SPFM12]|nr:putative virion structural protein [Salmonella phage SPFM12]
MHVGGKCASKAEWLKALYEPIYPLYDIWAEFKYSNVNYSTLNLRCGELNTNFLIEYLPDGLVYGNEQFRAFIQAQSFAITLVNPGNLLMGVKQRLNVQVDISKVNPGQVYDATANIQYTTGTTFDPRWLDANRGYRLSFLLYNLTRYTAVTETVDGAYSMKLFVVPLARGETYGGTDIVKDTIVKDDTFYIASNAGNELPCQLSYQRLPIDGSRVKFNGLRNSGAHNIPLESIPLWCDIQYSDGTKIKLVSPFLVDDNGTTLTLPIHIIKTNLVMAQETPSRTVLGEECTFLVYSDTGNVVQIAHGAETVVKQAIPGSCLAEVSNGYKDGVLKKNYLPVQTISAADGVRILRGSSVNDDAEILSGYKLPPTMVIDDAVTFNGPDIDRLNGHYPLRSDRYRVYVDSTSVPSWETEPFGGVGVANQDGRDLIVNDMTSGFDRVVSVNYVWDPSELYEPNKPTGYVPNPQGLIMAKIASKLIDKDRGFERPRQ